MQNNNQVGSKGKNGYQMELHVNKLANNYNSMGKKWQQDAKISRHQLLID